MNTTALRTFAPAARQWLLKAITDKAKLLGVTDGTTAPIEAEGDFVRINGVLFPKSKVQLRPQLLAKIKAEGFDAAIEAIAYTWFNRLVAIRFLEVNGYLPHGFRVLSDSAGGSVPEVLQNAQTLDLPTLEKNEVLKYLTAGNQQEELYQTILLAQCHALSNAMPFLFDRIDGATECLIPDGMLTTDSVVRDLVTKIPEQDWKTTEIVGWLYQFYVSEEKARVDAYVKRGKAVEPEDIPAKTQLFTPNWIVQFMTQNSLGRLWMDVYPNSSLKGKMEYYCPPAEQTPEVQAELKKITPAHLDPNDLTAIDPAAGSGHILIELYNLFAEFYKEQGYAPADIPRRILQNNLYGLELDPRAAQLAAFAVMMRARQDDPQILSNPPRVNVLAIKNSKGLDLESLIGIQPDEPIVPPSTLTDEGNPQPALKSAGRALLSDADLVKKLKSLFADAEIEGSLIRVPEEWMERLEKLKTEIQSKRGADGLFHLDSLEQLEPIVDQALLLGRRYTACVANPPYLGEDLLPPDIRDHFSVQYPNTSSDLCGMFLERCREYCNSEGKYSLITTQSWMYIKSFEEFRLNLVRGDQIDVMAHLGPSVFDGVGSIVKFTATVFSPVRLKECYSFYLRVYDDNVSEKPGLLRERPGRIIFSVNQSQFVKIPGCPIAYRLTDDSIRIFSEAESLGKISSPRQGMATGNSAKYLRYWFEVDVIKFCTEASSIGDLHSNPKWKWVPVDKGGEYRKWYGNNLHVVAFDRRNYEILKTVGNKCPSEKYYFEPGCTWTAISKFLSVRYDFGGHVFSNAGMKIFHDEEHFRLQILAILNSSVAHQLISLLSESYNFDQGQVKRIPFVKVDDVVGPTKDAIMLAKSIWDLGELSWDFLGFDFQMSGLSISQSIENLNLQIDLKVNELDSLEREIEEIICDAYAVESTREELPQISSWAKGPITGSEVSGILSFAVGCLMGRYSLDEAGLIYAHQGGEGFDPSRYRTVPADEDGILPITDDPYFEDQDTANRIAQWIQAVWPNSPLEENLAFLAANLGQKPSELPMDTLRRYVATEFFNNHMQMYKKRPIYWLFSSGKKRAFQALVYLHRYNEGTLSRMRTEYVQPLIGKLKARIESAENAAANASTASEVSKAKKSLKDLNDQLTELFSFEERLNHYAQQRIKLDLDDGVKVNYAKFGDLLARVKDVTGGKE